MTYRCGTRGMGSLEVPERDPAVWCDGAQCGKFIRVEKSWLKPYAWWANGKPPPKWTRRSEPQSDGRTKEVDLCPSCASVF